MLKHPICKKKSGRLRWAVPAATASIKKLPTKTKYGPCLNNLKASAWSPVIAVSYDLTDNSRLFARFAQATRFPQHLRSNHHQRQPAGSLQYRIQPEARTQYQLGSRLFLQFRPLLATAETRQHPPDLLQQHPSKNAIDITEKQKPDPI